MNEAPFSAEERRFMRRALALAARARGRTSPNPLVGAVLVKGGDVVGEGYHRRCGAAHAEAAALRAAGDSARGAHLFINLEPCSHFGLTPPCTDALLQAGVAAVTAALEDPDPRVSGKGIARLREAGVRVRTGLLADDAAVLNESYLKHRRTGLPWVTLKAAVTLDGRIATSSGDSRWVTGEAARLRVQRLRFAHDAVMVGVGTVLRDDPRLTLRDRHRKAGWKRVILDPLLETPSNARMFNETADQPVILFAAEADPERTGALRAKGACIEIVPGVGRELDLAAVLRRLGAMEVTAVLVEGGAQVFSAFMALRLPDKGVFFVAPRIIGVDGIPVVLNPGPLGMADVLTLRSVKVSSAGPDAVIEGYF